MRAETIKNLKGVVYRVQCESCGYVGEMPADQFIADSNELGLSECPKCGAQTLRQIGLAGSDPKQFEDEVNAITTVGEVEQAIEDTQNKLKKVVNEIDAKPSDPARMSALRRERAKLEAKLQALNVRWSVILDPSRARDS